MKKTIFTMLLFTPISCFASGIGLSSGEAVAVFGSMLFGFIVALITAFTD